MEVSDPADPDEIAVTDVPMVAPVVEPAATLPTQSKSSSQTLQQVRSNTAPSIAAMVVVEIYE